MKKMLFLLCFVSINGWTQAKYDTVFVNAETPSYLIFEDAIGMYNIGSKDFDAQVNASKMLFIKAKNSFVKPSTLVVTYGEEIFTAYLAFKKNANAFYDFRKPTKQVAPETPEQILQKRIENKLQKVQEYPANVSFAAEKQNILVKLQNIYNDTQATYLKFSLKNQSSMVYDVDYVSFAYIDKRKKKASKINTLNSALEEVEPMVKIEKLVTESGKSNVYLYAIPLYATTEDGYLQVIFREKAGLRSVTFEIPFKQILNAQLL